ncbi:hypothetical protein GCM10009535_12740 [Streptomyces thermocarboxydovorans]|uniref:TetR family transcriptional regulator n=1 Tax=Streptomyces thermocarboxydovorans TaxID=59298 RepID=A0ABN1HD73_9ACTN
MGQPAHPAFGEQGEGGVGDEIGARGAGGAYGHGGRSPCRAAFDDRRPLDWLVSATITLGHAASEEQAAGRLSAASARDALRVSLLRVLGASS